MTNKPWKIVLLLAAIFVAGGVTGGFATLRFGRKLIAERPMPDQWAPIHMRKLAEKLDLPPEQVEKIRPIVRRNLEEIGRLRNACLADTRTLFERMEHEVGAMLTPEQRVKFDEFNRDMRERAKKIMPNKSSRSKAEDRRPGKEPSPPETNTTEKGK